MEWISAMERLPRKGERVLMYTPYTIFGEDHACIGDMEGIRACTTEIEGRTVPIFTHWMPLPERPKGSRGKPVKQKKNPLKEV